MILCTCVHIVVSCLLEKYNPEPSILTKRLNYIIIGVTIVPDEPNSPDEPGALRAAPSIKSLYVEQRCKYIRFFLRIFDFSCLIKNIGDSSSKTN